MILVTGVPGTRLGLCVIEELLKYDPGAEIVCVAPSDARSELDPAGLAGRVTWVEGLLHAMDFGLSGPEYMDLAARVRVVHHCTQPATRTDATPEGALDGTREVLEFAATARSVERLVYWSSTSASSASSDRVLETELRGPGLDAIAYRAERMVRELAERVPTTVLRTAPLVGDSRNGTMEPFTAPMALLAFVLGAPTDMPLPLPLRRDVPFQVVSVDYAAAAGCSIARTSLSANKTYHILDPNPPSVKRAVDLAYDAAHRSAPRNPLPATLARALLRAPGVERMAQVPRSFLEQIATPAIYDDRQARELLSDAALTCPRFEEYVGLLVRSVRAPDADVPVARYTRKEEHDPLV
jgi:nucleoside-diphosphate-sugar epimerase